MDLVLSAGDLVRLNQALTTILSPLDSPTLDHWRVRVNEVLRALTGATKATFIMSLQGESLLCSDFDDSVVSAYFAYYASRDLGLARRDQLGLNVWSVCQLYSEPRAHTSSEIWNDWKRPNGALGATGITLRGGLQANVLLHDEIQDDRLEERQVALLGLVHAALEAGVRTYQRLGRYRESFVRTVDALDYPLGLFDLDGRLVHANAAADALLAADADRAHIRQACSLLAWTLGSIRRRPGAADSGVLLPAVRGLQTRSARYRLTGSLLAADQFGPGNYILVAIDRVIDPAAGATGVVAAFGLTPAEERVANLVAEGLSNEEIAGRLVISPHTVRHHVEAVLSKLEIPNRARVGPRLRGAAFSSTAER